MTAPESAPEIQADIDRTREHLGQTVEQLAAKADMKAQARAKAADIKAMAQGKAGEVKARAQGKAGEVKARAAEMSSQLGRSEMVQRRWPLAVAAAGVLVVGSVLAWRWRKT